ncbi:MAG: HEAT repeat domain-containing protein [Planctomycetota bacterium]
MLKQMTLSILVLTLIGGLSLGGTAVQYRGPEGANPYAIAPPTVDGPIGVERLASRGREIEGVSRWEFWWEMNRDRFLRRAAGRNEAALTGPGTFFAVSDRGPEWIGESDIRLRVVRALLSRLDSRDPEERARAAIALGKTRVSAAFGPLKEMLDDGTRSDRRAAALALGLLGEPVAAAELARFAGRPGVAPSDRAHAVLGLGLLGAPEGVPVLEKLLKESLSHRGRGITDFQAATATALGLLGQKSSADLLARVAGSRRGVDSDVRAAALVALGRINADGVVKVLARGLEDGAADVRRAAAGALGVTGRADARAHLLKAYREDPDVSVRSLAGMSMARIGGPNVGNALLGGLHRTNPRALRGFSALALGVLGDRRFAPKLRGLATAKDEKSLAGAAAVGLGILGDAGAVPYLRRVARDESKDPDLRGYATLALAMLGDRSTLRLLPARLGASNDADLRRSAALSLGLAGHMPSGPAILRTLFTEADGAVRGAVINSLSLLPRRAVLGTLVDVATGTGFSADRRIDAITALGSLASRGRPSPFEAMLDGVNYRSLTASLGHAVRQF